MERNEQSHTGTWGWAAMAGFIVGFDLLAPESLTHAFRRGVENPHSRPFVLGALAVTAAHLLDVIPHEPVELDPFYRTIDALRKSKEAP